MSNDKDPFKAFAMVLRQETGRAVNSVMQSMPCVLGTMTATGVYIDDFKHEIKDPLVLEPFIDADIEVALMVPAHEETGVIVLPVIPTQADSPTVPGDYQVTFKFDTWNYSAKANGMIKATRARVKFKPEYRPGDRVLCVLVNDSRDIVIVSRVVPYA